MCIALRLDKASKVREKKHQQKVVVVLITITRDQKSLLQLSFVI
jgi:hypothetical protein